jgi:hypothetical protein
VAEASRISIGFQGGQVLAVRVGPDALRDLRRALGHRPMGGEGKGFYDLEIEDGAVALNLDEVVYVHTDSGEHRVGFGL